jgi:large subunit ribosomal protein L17
MRHRLKGRKLGRTASHRKATLRSLSIALITHHRVVTTLAKAKELRRHVEPVITRSKEDTTHNRREVFSFIQDNKTVSKLFDEVGPKVGDRPGGYTRIVKIGYRTGDSADMAVIELVDYNTSGPEETGKTKKRTRRAGSGKTPTSVAAAPVAQEAEVVELAEDEAEVTQETSDHVASTEIEETSETSAEDATDEVVAAETDESTNVDSEDATDESLDEESKNESK